VKICCIPGRTSPDERLSTEDTVGPRRQEHLLPGYAPHASRLARQTWHGPRHLLSELHYNLEVETAGPSAPIHNSAVQLLAGEKYDPVLRNRSHKHQRNSLYLSAIFELEKHALF